MIHKDYNNWAQLLYSDDSTNIDLALTIFDGFTDMEKEQAIDAFLNHKIDELYQKILSQSPYPHKEILFLSNFKIVANMFNILKCENLAVYQISFKFQLCDMVRPMIYVKDFTLHGKYDVTGYPRLTISKSDNVTKQDIISKFPTLFKH